MVRSSVLALVASVSLGTLGLASDASARGGGGHFGGGHFGGGAREFRPEMREPRMEERRPEEHRSEERRPEVHHEADRNRDEHREENHEEHHERADEHRDQNHDAARNDLAHNDEYNHPINNNVNWHHNQFWNNNWGAHNWNCPNGCRWGWAGRVFWPFAYGDVFSYAWWPYAAAAPFWAYNVDYMLNGLFWPNGVYAWPGGGYGATAYSQTANNYQYARESHEDIYSAGPANANKQPVTADSSSTDVATCSGFAPGVSGLPVDKIEQAVKPTGAQRTALKDLEAASTKAEGILKASCPSEAPLTPIGRLDDLQKRLGAMTQAVDAVRGPLSSFDQSLSPEQKRALDTLGGANAAAASADLCNSKDGEFADVPVKQIEATVQPNDHQRAALNELANVSSKAASTLKATCPSQVSSTTEGRLDAMDKRLKATTTAMNEVRPALDGFYDSLSDEQKARFNTMQ